MGAISLNIRAQLDKSKGQTTITETSVTNGQLKFSSDSLLSRIVWGLSGWLHRHYYLTEEPALVLPSAPTDEEKVLYLVRHRAILVCVGIFTFMASSFGMWLCTTHGETFYLIGAIVAFSQLEDAIFILTGILAPNFDYEHHREVVQEHPVADRDAPTVDIYLPCCKEPPELLENVYRHVKKLKYPEGRLKVFVLDDGGVAEVKALALRYGFSYICREDRPHLKKAGNLRWAFERTKGDFFVVYDADFCPRRDFLTELVPRMKADPKIAILQTPQYFRTIGRQTWVERGAGAETELFYRYIMVSYYSFLISCDCVHPNSNLKTNRNHWGAAICSGSNAIYRRAALLEIGGSIERAVAEDIHTGMFSDALSLPYPC